MSTQKISAEQFHALRATFAAARARRRSPGSTVATADSHVQAHARTFSQMLTDVWGRIKATVKAAI
jgi:hypothetical protein